MLHEFSNCARMCQCDVLLPSTEKGQHSIVAWPGECWYCGACAVPTCLVPFYLKKRYPNSCDYAGLKIPYGLVVLLSGFALVVSVYLAIMMLIGMDTSSWMLILIMMVVTVVYFVGRVAYIKSHGGNLMADLRAPYQPGEGQEAKCKAMNETKAK